MANKKARKTKKSKKNIPKNPPGRPRRNYEFEQAVDKVRPENLRSVREYAQWYALNTPAKLPKRPDRAYKNDWKGWGYFLGTYNEMPGKGLSFRPYDDSRAFARKLNFTSVTQWHEYCRSGDKPEDIPARPDVYYQRTGEWFTWSEFLGTRIHHKIEYAQSKEKYLYIGKYQDAQNPNAYIFGVDTSTYNIVKDSDFEIVKVYKLDPDFDWVSSIERNGEQFFGNGRSNEYLIKNMGNLLYEISLELDEVRNLTYSS